MIVSFIPGRVRIHNRRPQNEAFAEWLQETAAGIPGLLSLQINPLAGSALIYYDPWQITPEDLLAANDHLFGPQRPPAVKPGPAVKNNFSLARVLIKRKAVVKAVDTGLVLTLAAAARLLGAGLSGPGRGSSAAKNPL